MSCRPSCLAAVGNSPAGPADGKETFGDPPILTLESSRARAAPSPQARAPTPGPPCPVVEAWSCPPCSASSELGAGAVSQGSWPRLAEGLLGLGPGLICNDAARRGFLQAPVSAPRAALACEAMAGCEDPRGQWARSHATRALLHARASSRVGSTWHDRQRMESSASYLAPSQ